MIEFDATPCLFCGHYPDEHSDAGACEVVVIRFGGDAVCDCRGYIHPSQEAPGT